MKFFFPNLRKVAILFPIKGICHFERNPETIELSLLSPFERQHVSGVSINLNVQLSPLYFLFFPVLYWNTYLSCLSICLSLFAVVNIIKCSARMSLFKHLHTGSSISDINFAQIRQCLVAFSCVYYNLVNMYFWTKKHPNVFITVFIITHLWILHRWKMDPRMYRFYRKLNTYSHFSM